MEGIREDSTATLGAASSSVVTRPIEDREKEYIQEVLAAHHQDALYKGWVCLQDPETKALRDRILVVSNFRVIALKVLEDSGPQIQENAPILDLKEVFMDKNDPFYLSLRFREDIIIVVSPFCIQVLEAVLFANLAITYGVPDTLLPTIKIPLPFIEEFTPPVPDEQTGLIASYLAICDYLEIPCRPQIIDYLITCFQTNNEELDLKSCLYYVDPKPSSLDIDALTTALRFNTSFKKLVIQGVVLNDDSMEMIAKIFSYNDFITHLTLINLKPTKSGITPFAACFSKGFHGLKNLKIVKFPIGDAGMELLASALDRAKQPLKRLALVEVGMTSKGFKELIKLLTNKKWSKSLKTLDFSDNRLGRNSGSQALAAWLLEADGLEVISASYCDLDLDIVLDSLKDNNSLLGVSLDTINFSGNKISSTSLAFLEQILAKSTKLENISFAKTSMKKGLYEGILQAMKKSKAGKYFLDLSNNDLGVQIGKSIYTIFDAPNRSITALILMQNELGAEGIINLCKALKNLVNLQTLVLDINASTGLFTKINDIGVALSNLIQDLPSLTFLSIAGDGSHYLKGGLNPLLSYLGENHTLTSLNIQSNRLQDDGFDALIDMIKKNQCLTLIDSDNNGWKLKNLRKLREAVVVNASLTQKATIPFNDIAAIYASYPKYKEEIFQLVLDIENRLTENEKRGSRQLTETDVRQAKRLSYVTGRMTTFDAKKPSTLAIDELAAMRLDENKQIFPSTESEGLSSPEAKDHEGEAKREISHIVSVSEKTSPIAPKKTTKMERATSHTNLVSAEESFTAGVFKLEELANATFYPLEDLRDKEANALPAGVKAKFREMYLRDTEFQVLFKCTKAQFLDLPRWKQVQKKRDVGLF